MFLGSKSLAYARRKDPVHHLRGGAAVVGGHPCGEGKRIGGDQRIRVEHFENVSATEISQLEQELVADGLPVMDIQKLCDVHASVFKGSIAEIHQQQNPIDIPGHPIHVFHQENDHIDKHLTSAFETDNKDDYCRKRQHDAE